MFRSMGDYDPLAMLAFMMRRPFCFEALKKYKENPSGEQLDELYREIWNMVKSEREDARRDWMFSTVVLGGGLLFCMFGS